MKYFLVIMMVASLAGFVSATPMVYMENASPPTENVIVSLTTGSGNIWNSITVANNDGSGTEQMYGQSFKHASAFDISAISVSIPDTKSYGAGQMLELAILRDTNSDDTPDTLVGSVHSVSFTSISGSTPWKTFTLASPVSCAANIAYEFVFTLLGPVTNNMRVTTDNSGSIYTDGKGINTEYNAGSFPAPLPPSLNSGRDIYFVIQGSSGGGGGDPTEVFVATDGNDGNAGTLASPFATVQMAASVMNAGDTCYIRGGTYHEEAVIGGLVGSAGSKIIFTNYEDEVVIFDGTKTVSDLGSTGWTQHSGNIYKTTLNQDIWQLIIDGEMMIPARWPNGFLHDETIYDRDVSWSDWDTGSTNGNAIDADLDAAGLDATGAIGIFNSGSWKTWGKTINSHDLQTGVFTFDLLTSFGSNEYYLECKLELLDAEREWYYDPATKELYLWTVGGGTPTGDIRGKVQSYALDVSGSQYVTIDGIDFLGTTFNFDDCPYSTVQNCDLMFPSCSQRMLGIIGRPQTSSIKMANNSNACNATVFNCSFQYADSDGIHMKGTGCTLDNNEFRYIDFSCADLPGLMVTIIVDGDDALITRNFIEKTGASAMFNIGRAEIAYNRITATGFLQHDGSMTQYTTGATDGSVVHNNWYHDGTKSGARFDCPNPPTRWGVNGTMHSNVCYKVGTGLLPKGNSHFIYNNTATECSNDIAIHDYNDGSGATNSNTITLNNAATILTGQKGSGGCFPLPGTHDHNWNGCDTGTSLLTQLRDPANWDFRPKAGSDLIDAGIEVPDVTDGFLGTAPDIGAYEYGATNYWMGGRQYETAASPSPPDAGIIVKTDADLMWMPALNGLSYDVYFGTVSGSLTFQGNQTNNIMVPGTLNANTTYFWRVDTVTAGGTLPGTEWSFYTGVPAGESLTLPSWDDFETGFGNWTSGGADTMWDSNGTYAYEGTGCVDLQDDSSSSLLTLTKSIDATQYTDLRIDFAFKMVGMDTADDFFLEYYDGTSWLIVGSYGQPFGQSNNQFYTMSVTVDGATYNMPPNASLRFRGSANGEGDDAYIDAITITDIGGSGNNPPAFDTDPITEIDATEDAAYSITLANDASDPESDPMTFSKTGGPGWLSVAANGGLSGTPTNANVGPNVFIVQVAATGGTDTATLNITVYGSVDINGDGNINNIDFYSIAVNWMDNTCAAPTWCDGADFDISGTVDIADLRKFVENWLD